MFYYVQGEPFVKWGYIVPFKPVNEVVVVRFINNNYVYRIKWLKTIFEWWVNQNGQKRVIYAEAGKCQDFIFKLLKRLS